MAYPVTIVWRKSKAGEYPLTGIQQSPSGGSLLYGKQTPFTRPLFRLSLPVRRRTEPEATGRCAKR